MVDLTGHTIASRYQIIRLIAGGGMATVYLAKDLRLDRPVALKIIHPHLAGDQDFREKFIQEAKISAKLSHTNLVNVYDQGQDGEHIYLAMEYVPGITLREALQNMGPLTAAQALELYEQLLSGLAAAHQAGILHRDLKPENVLLSDDGRIKLADFGLARKVADQTQVGDLVGTVAYLSPELVTKGTVDARSDVYAAGVMLFELVTGKQPFQGEQAVQIAMQHANASVAAPSSINPGVPEIIDDIVLWATEREPDERPKDAAELLAAVRQAKKITSATTTNGHANQNRTTVIPVSEQTGEANSTQVLNLSQTPSQDATQILRVADVGPEDLPVASAAQTQILNREMMHDSSPQVQRLRSDANFKPAVAILTAVAVLLLGLGVGWSFGSGPFAPFQVPSVAGLSEAQARDLLAGCHCQVTTQNANSTSVPTGQVISTSPAAGAMIWGSPIKLSISIGAKLVAAPKLIGLNVAEATAEVLKSGFKLGKVSSWFNQAPIGTIYEYQGSDGSKIAENSTIDLKISLGSLPILSNIDEALATTALQAAGLKVAQVTKAPSDTVAIGKVINFVPLTDPIGAGGEVELIVSSGPAN